jgi:hypothetical protein
MVKQVFAVERARELEREGTGILHTKRRGTAGRTGSPWFAMLKAFAAAADARMVTDSSGRE